MEGVFPCLDLVAGLATPRTNTSRQIHRIRQRRSLTRHELEGLLITAISTGNGVGQPPALQLALNVGTLSSNDVVTCMELLGRRPWQCNPWTQKRRGSRCGPWREGEEPDHVICRSHGASWFSIQSPIDTWEFCYKWPKKSI